jgi:hypothetical protein
MATLDLDARRAARAETIGGPHEVTLGGEVFHLRPMLPLEALDLMAEGKFRPAFRLMLVPDTEDDTTLARFFANFPDESDLEDIVEGLYGQRSGERSASRPSSANGGRPSKPTSPPTTGSTLPVPATERINSALGDSLS